MNSNPEFSAAKETPCGTREGNGRPNARWLRCIVVLGMGAGIGLWLLYRSVVIQVMGGDGAYVQYVPSDVAGLARCMSLASVIFLYVVLRSKREFMRLSKRGQRALLIGITVLVITTIIGTLFEPTVIVVRRCVGLL